MPYLGSTIKQPVEIEQYGIDYSDDLDPSDNFTIQSISIIALDGSEEGLPEVEHYAIYNDSHTVKLFISGGTNGVAYKITVKILTDTGRYLEDEFKLKIRDY